jgi:hypothetical protein
LVKRHVENICGTPNPDYSRNLINKKPQSAY